MRFIIIFIATLAFAQTYNFDEIKYIDAIKQSFKKSGIIKIEPKRIEITYTKPFFQKISSDGREIIIEDNEKNIKKLEGKTKLYSKFYVDLIKEIDKSKTPKNNRYFDVKKSSFGYELYPKDEMKNYIKSVALHVEHKEIKEFKITMQNKDSITIIKK